MKRFHQIACLLTLLIFLWQPAQSSEDKQSIENSNIHMAVGVLLAIFYCSKDVWPDSLQELEIFEAENNVGLPHEIDWKKLNNPKVEFNVENNVTFKTPKFNIKSNDFPVTSTHSYPSCQNGNITVNTHIHLGG